MTLIGINMVAALVIFLWSIWCVFSSSVHDGLVGKLIYAVAALSSFAILTGGDEPQTAYVTLNCCMAALAGRHFFLRTYWPRLRAAVVGKPVFQRRESDGL